MEEITISKELLDKFYYQARNRAKRSEIYHKLTRRKYRPVSGYQDWLDVMLEFAVALESCAKGVLQLHLNPMLLMGVQLMNAYHSKHASSYWLDKNLAEIFLNCDIPDGLTELPSAIPCGLLFLPLEKAPLDPNGKPISWMVFYKALKGEVMPAIFYGNRYATTDPMAKDCILWISQASDTSLYSGGITPDFKTHSVTASGQYATKEEESLNNKLSSLLIQSLLVAQYYPEWSLQEESGIGFAKASSPRSAKKENSWLNPKWIGDLYKKHRTPRRDLGGTHASPCFHNRRGHWRNQACGPGWRDRKMILVEPTEVKSGANG